MKKLSNIRAIIAIVLLLLPVITIGQEVLDAVYELEYNKKELKEINYRGKPTFVFIDSIRNSQDYYVLPRKLPDGNWAAFYSNDTSKIAFHFIAKNDSGFVLGKRYYENGKVQSEVSYRNGKKEGRQINYFANGGIESVEKYRKDKLDGLQFFNYPSGNRCWENEYRKGKKIGFSRHWDENGQLSIEVDHRMN